MGLDDLFFLCHEIFFSNQKFSVDLGPRVEMGSIGLSIWGGRVEWVRKKPLLLQTSEEWGMFVTTAVSRISLILTLQVDSGCVESAHNAGDLGSIPGSGRSPGEGNGYPLQYSCLEKEMATHSSILAWRIPWMEDSGGLQSTG